MKYLSNNFSINNKYLKYGFYGVSYMDFVIHKLINYFMLDGKKRRAFKYLDECCFLIKRLTKLPPLLVINKAIYNCMIFFNHDIKYNNNMNNKYFIKKIKIKRMKKYKSDFNVEMLGLDKSVMKSIKFLYSYASTIYSKSNKYLSFGERLAIGILLIFFNKSFVFKDIKKLYTMLVYNRLSLKEIVEIEKKSKKYLIKKKRNKKDKGYYLFNPYSLSYWLKEKDKTLLFSRR